MLLPNNYVFQCFLIGQFVLNILLSTYFILATWFHSQNEFYCSPEGISKYQKLLIYFNIFTIFNRITPLVYWRIDNCSNWINNSYFTACCKFWKNIARLYKKYCMGKTLNKGNNFYSISRHSVIKGLAAVCGTVLQVLP